jgi:hypothetical protein
MNLRALAIDPTEAANQVIGASVATGIMCLASIPAADAAASPGLCIACGILIAKTFDQFIDKIIFTLI